MSARPLITVRGFKWPRRPTAVAPATLLGTDAYGRWLGIAAGQPWRAADGSHAGVFDHSFVKLVPSGTFWTACFHPHDPVVDVDIVLPVRWRGATLEEVDLELDILRAADGQVAVRDQEAFARVAAQWPMPVAVRRAAERTCAQIAVALTRRAEPFGEVGAAWLAGFLRELPTP